MSSPNPTSIRNSFRPSVRRVDKLIIIFRDKHTVIICEGNHAVVFQRWFDRHLLDYTKYWQPFCRALRFTKELSLPKCYNLASRYRINVQSFHGDVEKILASIEESTCST